MHSIKLKKVRYIDLPIYKPITNITICCTIRVVELNSRKKYSRDMSLAFLNHFFNVNRLSVYSNNT